MRWRVWLMSGVVGLAVVAPAAGEQPPAPVLHAQAQTMQASSMRISMRLTIRAAGQSLALTASGFERPKAHQASMVVDMTQLSPSVGKMHLVAVGSRYYIHYDMLDTLHVTHPQVKPWIVADSASAIGFDPWSFGSSMSSMDDAVHYRLIGRTGGTSRYRASVDLRSAIAANPQLKSLLSQAGSDAAGLLHRSVPVVLSIGDDGYLHRAVEQLTMTIGGQTLSMKVDLGFSDFNGDHGAVSAPPSDQVMTLAQFKQLANG
jgi:hypothetical protein